VLELALMRHQFDIARMLLESGAKENGRVRMMIAFIDFPYMSSVMDLHPLLVTPSFYVLVAFRTVDVQDDKSEQLQSSKAAGGVQIRFGSFSKCTSRLVLSCLMMSP